MRSPAQPVLTQRDLAILQMVYSYGGVTASLIQQRFFPSHGTGSPSACYRRLALLVGAGLLDNSHHLIPSSRIGAARSFLTLGRNARPLIADLLKPGRSELKRSRLAVPATIDHHIAICELRLAVELAAEASPVFAVADWLSEREWKEQPLRLKDLASGEDRHVSPDGSFTLVSREQGSEQVCYLEMDRDSIPLSRLAARLRCYLWHAQQAGPRPVFFVTLSERRRDAIARLVCQQAEKLSLDPTIFMLATKNEITEATALAAPVWRVAGGPDRLALVDLMESSARQSDASPVYPVPAIAVAEFAATSEGGDG